MFGKKNKNEVHDDAKTNVELTAETVDTGISDSDINSEEFDAVEVDYSSDISNNVSLIKEGSNSDSNGDESNEDTEKPKDLILYIIMDKSNPSILQYYRECGVNVSKIFTNINDAKDTLLMQVEPVKILIIDTGTGRFSAMGSRKELLDLMGICDEDARISVYYTDTVIKSEVEYNDSFEEKNIHWHKFKSNTDVVAHLLRNKGKENYIYDKEDKDKVKDTPEDILNFTGFKFSESDQINIGAPSITANDVIIHMSDDNAQDNLVESYVITKI